MASLCITNGLHSLWHRSIELAEVFCSGSSPYLVGDFSGPPSTSSTPFSADFCISDPRLRVKVRAIPRPPSEELHTMVCVPLFCGCGSMRRNTFFHQSKRRFFAPFLPISQNRTFSSINSHF